MNRKVFFKVLIIFIILVSITSTVAMAVGEEYTNPNQFDNASYHSNGNTGVDKVINNGLTIALDLIRNVAFGWAIMMLIIISIKYMVATPDAKGQLKKDVPTYCIGAILLFGAAGIMQLITYFVKDTVGL